MRRFLDALDGDDLPIIIEDDYSPSKRKNWKPRDAKKALADRVSQKISEGDVHVKGAIPIASSDDTLITPNTYIVHVYVRGPAPETSPQSL